MTASIVFFSALGWEGHGHVVVISGGLRSADAIDDVRRLAHDVDQLRPLLLLGLVLADRVDEDIRVHERDEVSAHGARRVST